MKTARVRIYYPFFPFPPYEGSFHVVFDQIRTLSLMGFEVELVCWKDSLDEVQKKIQLSYPDPFPTQVVFRVLSDRKTESFGSKLIRVGHSLVSEFSSPELLFYPPHVCPSFQEPVDLAIYNYSFAYPWLKRDQVLGKNSAPTSTHSNLELKQHQNLAQKIEKRQVVVFHNLESELFEQRAEQARKQSGLKSRITGKIHQVNFQKLRKHELELEKWVDEVWWISPEDQSKYFEWRGDQSSSVRHRLIPPGFSENFRKIRMENCGSFKTNGNKAKGDAIGKRRPVLGFIGKLDFLPNHVSLTWLVKELAPRLKKNGFGGEVRVVGKGASSDLLAAAAEFPFIQFCGYLENLEDFWADLDFSLVPHFMGSGVRIKLLESLASGIPCLATSGAVSRIHPSLLESPLLWVSNDPEKWVSQIMNPDALKLRQKEIHQPLPPSLNSLLNYSFLESFLVS